MVLAQRQIDARGYCDGRARKRGLTRGRGVDTLVANTWIVMERSAYKQDSRGGLSEYRFGGYSGCSTSREFLFSGDRHVWKNICFYV